MGKHRVLIADDDLGILHALELMLKFKGYEVLTSTNGQKLFEIASQYPQPDLLILDIWMSGEDGTEICRQLKTDIQTREMPILMVSASHEIEKAARSAGADDFLPKPFEMNQLIAKIQALITRQTETKTPHL